MKKIDTHIHTRFSLDSEENPEHYILKALELGLDEICFTDHYDVAYPGADFTMNIPEYMAHMTSLQKKYQNQLKIYIGIEMGLDPIHKDEIELLLKKYPFDFVIGSIHAIGHQEFFQGDYFRGKSILNNVLNVLRPLIVLMFSDIMIISKDMVSMMIIALIPIVIGKLLTNFSS